MKKRRAFTLIELLIVVAIIAILAVIIIINLLNARQKANYAKARSELKTVSDGIKLSYVDTIPAATASWTNLSDTAVAKFKDDQGVQLIPAPPVSPWGSGYNYSYFNASATSFGVRIVDPKGGFCGFINGNLFTGESAAGTTGGTVTYTRCDGS